MRTDRVTPRYAHHKPFTSKLPGRCEWQNGFKPDIKGLVWYTERSETNKGPGAEVYR